MWKNQFYDAEEEETVRSLEALMRAVQDDEQCQTSTSQQQVLQKLRKLNLTRIWDSTALQKTFTSQAEVEADVLGLYKTKNPPILAKSKHAAYLKKSLTHISTSCEVRIPRACIFQSLYLICSFLSSLDVSWRILYFYNDVIFSLMHVSNMEKVNSHGRISC